MILMKSGHFKDDLRQMYHAVLNNWIILTKHNLTYFYEMLFILNKFS